jgi:hypothetical protein
MGRSPTRLRERPLLLAAGSRIHKRALTFSGRSQSQSTWFLRNEPLLLTIRDLVAAGFTLGVAHSGFCFRRGIQTKSLLAEHRGRFVTEGRMQLGTPVRQLDAKSLHQPRV